MPETGTPSKSQFDAMMAKGSVVPPAPEPYDKHQLLGVPFLITEVEFRESTLGTDGQKDYVKVTFVLATGFSAFFSDGSTGVKEQLKEMSMNGIALPWGAPNGLRLSKYANQYKPDNETFYIA